MVRPTYLSTYLPANIPTPLPQTDSIEVDKPGEVFCQLCINYLPVSLSFVLLTYLMSHASFNQTKDKGSSSSSSSVIKTSGPNGQGTYSFVGLYKLYTSVVYFY